ncbi:MAG: TAXI family TRAP transporter solute-binding subunit, partial [Burkholderiales bacterium]
MTTRRQFITVGALAIAGVPAARAQGGRINIATNPAGTLYYQLGGGFAKLLNEKLGVQAIVQPYAGTSAYLPLIGSGEVTMALSSTLDAGSAYRGEQGRTSMLKLRSLARMFPLRYALLVRKDSPIQKVGDLRGRRVVLNFKANVGLNPLNHAVLATAGLTEKDVVPTDVAGIPQGVRGVVEGTTEGTWVAVGIPVVKEAHASVGIRYVDLSGPNFTEEFLGSRVQGLFPITVPPAPNLPEVTEPIQVVGYDIFMMVSADMPAERARTILGALHEGFPGLQNDYPALRSGDVKRIASPTNTVPFHPAAIDYYRSKGLWSA